MTLIFAFIAPSSKVTKLVYQHLLTGLALNNKTEWGGAKVPGLLVTSPKGTGGKKAENKTKDPEVFWVQTGGERGQKRIRYLGDDTGEDLVETVIEDEEMLAEQRPSKSRRTSDTPASEDKGGTKETFLQVFNRYRKA